MLLVSMVVVVVVVVVVDVVTVAIAVSLWWLWWLWLSAELAVPRRLRNQHKSHDLLRVKIGSRSRSEERRVGKEC